MLVYGPVSMATKTISVGLETNGHAVWPPAKQGTASDLLARVEGRDSSADVALLDEAQAADLPTNDFWKSAHGRCWDLDGPIAN